jgi:predicted DNA-binding antitoxin AbrB/MazE fold protein
MYQQLINAVFENGSFRPLEPLSIGVREGDRVRLRVEGSPEPTSIDLACRVYDGLSDAEIAEIERIALDRSSFFRTRNSD